MQQNYPVKVPTNSMNALEKFIISEIRARHNSHVWSMIEKLPNDGRHPTPYDMFATTVYGHFFMIEVKSTTRNFIKINDRLIRQVNQTYNRWRMNPRFHRGVFIFGFLNDQNVISEEDEIYAIYIQHMKILIDMITEHDQKTINEFRDQLTTTQIKHEFFTNSLLPSYFPEMEFYILKIPLFKTKKLHADFTAIPKLQPINAPQPSKIEGELLIKTKEPQKHPLITTMADYLLD